MKIAALIGTTASGKSDIAHSIASNFGAVLFSLDSLSIYKYIDIASAKPSQSEREHFSYFGLDMLEPDEAFNITMLFDAFHEAKAQALANRVPLLLVGGSSFYLKSFVDGLSVMPTFDDDVLKRVEQMLQSSEGYHYLQTHDAAYAKKIEPADHYRLGKALRIMLQTNLSVTDYFLQNPPVKVIPDEIAIFNVTLHSEQNRARIIKRTDAMFSQGLVKEVAWLQERYQSSLQSMRAIGIKEILAHLNGELTLQEAKEQIINHTAQLAKRQRTFNKKQFSNITHDTATAIHSSLNDYFS